MSAAGGGGEVLRAGVALREPEGVGEVLRQPVQPAVGRGVGDVQVAAHVALVVGGVQGDEHARQARSRHGGVALLPCPLGVAPAAVGVLTAVPVPPDRPPVVLRHLDADFLGQPHRQDGKLRVGVVGPPAAGVHAENLPCPRVAIADPAGLRGADRQGGVAVGPLDHAVREGRHVAFQDAAVVLVALPPQRLGERHRPQRDVVDVGGLVEAGLLALGRLRDAGVGADVVADQPVQRPRQPGILRVDAALQQREDDQAGHARRVAAVDHRLAREEALLGRGDPTAVVGVLRVVVLPRPEEVDAPADRGRHVLVVKGHVVADGRQARRPGGCGAGGRADGRAGCHHSRRRAHQQHP